MDVTALASTPIFVCSLAICAVVAMYGFATLLQSFFGGIFKFAASAGLHPEELRAVELTGTFHNQLEVLIERVVALEEIANEEPEVFNDASWSRLLDMCDDLESVRGEIHSYLGAKDFTTVSKLGRFLSGVNPTVPNLPRAPGAVELRRLSNWHFNGRDLIQRMVAKLEDSLNYKRISGGASPSSQLKKTLEELKRALEEDEQAMEF